jgi:hypothetical protein
LISNRPSFSNMEAPIGIKHGDAELRIGST